MIPTGRQYKQRYGGLFHVTDGKIELFRESYDPILFQYVFGLGESSDQSNLDYFLAKSSSKWQ